MSEKLKPCPFCGHKDIGATDDGYAVCAYCEARMDVDTSNVSWNTRPIEDALRAEVAKAQEAQMTSAMEAGELRAEVAALKAAMTEEGHSPTNMQMWVARSLKAEDMVLGLQTELAKRDEPLRPALAAFALAMEAKLKANDHKGGWAGCDEHWLMDRLYEEADELCDAINKGDPEAVAPEAADVANFAMMIYDAAIRRVRRGE